MRFAALRRRRARRGDGVTGLPDRNRFHRDSDGLGRGAGEQPVQPRPRHGRGVDGRCRAVLGALLGRRQQFQREAIAGDAERLVEFGLGAVRAALFDGGGDIGAETHLAAEIGALAVLGVAFRLPGRIAGGALFGVLSVDGALRGAKLAFEVGRPRLDPVQFGAGFVGERFGDGELGHPLALSTLPLAKLAQALHGFCHDWEASRFWRPSAAGRSASRGGRGVRKSGSSASRSAAPKGFHT